MARGHLDVVTVISVVVIALVLVGEASVYLFDVNQYGAEVTWDGDTASYSVYSSGSDGYSVVALSGTDRVSELCIFKDETFDTYLSAARDVLSIPGVSQDYVVNEIIKLLGTRGLSDMSVVDSEGLCQYLTSTLADASGRGLLVSGYSLPSSVYAGDSSDLLIKWVEAGGRLYCMSPEIGRFYTDSDGLHEVSNNLSLFLGKDDCVFHPDGRIKSTGFDDAGMYSALCLRSFSMANSVDVSGIPDSASFGASYLGYSTVVSVALGSGSVTLVTGIMQLEQFDDMVQVIASGVDYDTVIVDVVTGDIKGTVTGTVGGCDSVYVFIGGINTVFARYSHV